MASAIDQTLVRQPSETDEFSAKFVDGIGLGLCNSEQNLRRFGGVPPGMEFRITYDESQTRGAVVWVRPADLQAYEAEQREKRDRRSMRGFLQSLPILVGLSIVISLICGGYSTFRAYTTGSIYGLETNLMFAFLLGAGVPAVICALYLICTALRRGRVD